MIKALAATASFLTLVAAAPVQAADYDNPQLNGAACVGIASFETSKDGVRSIARTSLENVCRTAMEVSFCLTAVGEEVEAICSELNIRPDEVINLRNVSEEARLTGPSIQWRYLTMSN